MSEDDNIEYVIRYGQADGYDYYISNHHGIKNTGLPGYRDILKSGNVARFEHWMEAFNFLSQSPALMAHCKANQSKRYPREFNIFAIRKGLT